ncbi:MAG: hypothetical protein RLZ98_1092 [Pseudomonadota bacterium]|jgi:phenylpropionate dioxygenase-like ring-hydroxylating dioxygenase large terminal subunit
MFLKNGWYAALWSKDLGGKPVGRTYLGEKVVLFRTTSGKAAALEDSCIHRAAPLSLGEVKDECLACGYHGLEFDTTGQVVRVPGETRIPPGAKIKSYPVHEKWGVVWIWMGDHAKADVGKVPSLPWLESDEWVATPGYLHVKCNYQYLVDNLLDLTHVAYVHRNTIGADPAEATTPTKTERTEDGVKVGRWMLDVKPPPLFVKAGGFNTNVDRWQWVTWQPPSTVFLDVGCATANTGAPEGDRSKGISIWSNHLIAPETETTTHYMFAFARNFQLDNEEMSKTLFEGSKFTFEEDVVFLEAVQRNRQVGELDGLVHITADAAQLQARRMLAQLIEAEQA